MLSASFFTLLAIVMELSRFIFQSKDGASFLLLKSNRFFVIHQSNGESIRRGF